MAEHWKRPRQKSPSQSCAGNKSLRATSVTITPGESSANPGILDELAERLGNFHDGARALADCLQTRDVTGKTDQSMMETAKCMFHKLLGEASDDLERVTPHPRESLQTGRYSRPETPSEKPCSRFETSRLRNLVHVPRHPVALWNWDQRRRRDLHANH